MKLSELPINEEHIIAKVNGQGALRHRLLEMGIIPGTKIKISKVAPLGDPLQIHIRGYELSIRKSDAELIEVE
ncbi:MAG: ferrous iron transport protein A [Bacilli bacterium]